MINLGVQEFVEISAVFIELDTFIEMLAFVRPLDKLILLPPDEVGEDKKGNH
jgi:hypothetical protein